MEIREYNNLEFPMYRKDFEERGTWAELVGKGGRFSVTVDLYKLEEIIQYVDDVYNTFNEVNGGNNDKVDGWYTAWLGWVEDWENNREPWQKVAYAANRFFDVMKEVQPATMLLSVRNKIKDTSWIKDDMKRVSLRIKGGGLWFYIPAVKMTKSSKTSDYYQIGKRKKQAIPVTKRGGKVFGYREGNDGYAWYKILKVLGLPDYFELTEALSYQDTFTVTEAIGDFQEIAEWNRWESENGIK